MIISPKPNKPFMHTCDTLIYLLQPLSRKIKNKEEYLST